MNKAKYTEALASGGKLNVTENGWYIKYYFNGPDLRYNGEFVTIQGSDVDIISRLTRIITKSF